MPRFIALAALVIAFTPAAQAADPIGGRDLYRFYCASCHGLEADGRGPMAPIMTVQPTDLTALKAQNDGVFPRWKVITRIDGRDPLVAHGSDMPVFGPWFESDNLEPVKLETGQPALASGPVIDLMTYLERIQK